MKSPIRNTDTDNAISCKEIYDDITMKTFLGHKKFLEEIVDADLEFLKTLLCKGALTRNEARSLSGKRLHGERNAELLEYITDQEKCHSFIDSLRETKQTHVVNYLIGDGIFNDEFGSDWPLTTNQIQILNSSQVFLVELLNISDILNELCLSDVIKATQKRLIDSSQESAQKINTFLQILRRMNQENFRHVMKCFCETGQSFVAEFLDDDRAEVAIPTNQATKAGVTFTESPATTMCDRTNECVKVEMLVRHKIILEEIVDSCSGLLDKLLSKGTLTRRQIRFIKSKTTYQERNAKLLEFITDQEKCDSFVDSLRDTKQTHVVNYLIGDGEHNDEFGGDWPLTDTQMQTLNDNQVTLVDLIDTKDLLTKLFFLNVINIRHIESIYSQESSFKKNEVFLNILRRQSQSDLRQTIKCLRETHQDHIAEILDKGGVIFRIHVKTGATIEEEDEFVIRLPQELGNKYAGSSRHIVKLKQLKVIAAKAGRSIVLYVYCQKLQDFEFLQMSLKSGRFKDLIELLFNSLLHIHSSSKVNVKSVTAEDDVAELRFGEIKKGYCNSNSSEKDGSLLLNGLPPEVLEMIFRQSYRLSIRNSESKKNLADRSIIENLITVNLFRLQRLPKRRCRKATYCRIAEHFQRLSKSYTVVKNNQEFLLEFIRPCDELIDTLESAEYLTKEKVGIIKKLRRDRDKNFELLHMLKPFDSQKIDLLVRSLRQTKQDRVASVIENGGVMVKITAKNATDAVKQMIERLNDFLYQRDRSSKAVKIINDDNYENNFIRRRKMKASWIWFQERKAFQTMKTLFSAESLNCIEYDVAVKDCFTIIPSDVNVDSRKFENKFASFSIFAKFIGRLECNYSVGRLTKLKNKIFVSCPEPKVIYVFDDRNQFHHETQIEMTENEVKEMVPCEKENCLYVHVGVRGRRSDKNWIWKITEESENQQLKYKIVTWLELEHQFLHSISVTSSSEVIICIRDSTAYQILIYGSDAYLRLSILLPEEIKDLQHVLKTSNGDLIVLHTLNRSAKLERKHKKKLEEVKTQKTNILVNEKLVPFGARVDEEATNEENRNYNLNVAISRVKIIGEMSSCVDQYVPQNKEQILLKVEHLAIDSDDRLFVPDCQNHRVILIDRDLEWDKMLISTKEEKDSQAERNITLRPSNRPSSLLYDETNKQLIVVEECGTVVDVYTLTWIEINFGGLR